MLHSFFISARIAKESDVITSRSAAQSRVILRSFLCSNNDVALVAYPSGGVLDQGANALEWVFDVNGGRNGWTVNSACAAVNAREIMELASHVSGYWGRVMKGRGSGATKEKQLPESGAERGELTQDEDAQQGELIAFNIDLKELVRAMEVVNVCVSPVTIQLTRELQLVTPSVSVINSQGEGEELNVILKDFRVMDEAQRVVEVKDVLMAVDFDAYSVHCSTDACAAHLDATHVLPAAFSDA